MPTNQDEQELVVAPLRKGTTLSTQANEILDEMLKNDSNDDTASVEFDNKGVEGRVEKSLPHGWSVAAWAKYYWNQTWAAAGKVTKRW